MLFMIIEHYRDKDPVPVYRRFNARGRMAPDGLRYVASWVTTDHATCYQIMEGDDPRLIDEWTANWTDLVDFEVIPVVTSADVVAAIGPRL